MNASRTLMTVVAVTALGGARIAQAQGAPLVVETVTVGNPGYAGDPQPFQGVFGAALALPRGRPSADVPTPRT